MTDTKKNVQISEENGIDASKQIMHIAKLVFSSLRLLPKHWCSSAFFSRTIKAANDSSCYCQPFFFFFSAHSVKSEVRFVTNLLIASFMACAC